MPETVPSPLRMPIVSSILHGVIEALTAVQASPAERASIARSIYVTIMLDLAQDPLNFEAARGSMREVSAQVGSMAAFDSVGALTAFCRDASLRSTFEHTDAPVVG